MDGLSWMSREYAGGSGSGGKAGPAKSGDNDGPTNHLLAAFSAAWLRMRIPDQAGVFSEAGSCSK